MGKKSMLLGTAIIGMCMLSSCASEADIKEISDVVEDIGNEVVDQTANIADADDPNVLGVKNGTPVSYPDISYGEAFDSFFAAPTWKYFKAETGEDVVEFTGYCTYANEEVKAVLQFILDNNGGTFTTGGLSFNDVPQTQLITAALIEVAFDEYREAHPEKENVEVVSENQSESNLNTENVNVQNMSTNSKNNEEVDYASWETGYKRSVGPYCMLYVNEVSEAGINFSIGCGGSGYTSICEMNGYQATWEEDGIATYEDSLYFITFILMNDGSIEVEESLDSPFLVSLSGTYIRDDQIQNNIHQYVFSHSNQYEVSEKELEGLNAWECKIARNEIYARHGRRFSDEVLQAYFETCTWYNGTIEPESFSENVLNEVELLNLNKISTYEINMGYR